MATELLRRSVALNERLVALDPNGPVFSAYFAYENALLNTLLEETGSSNDEGYIAATSIIELRKLASRPDASSEILYRAAFVMVSVLPSRLRDSRLAVQYAERLAASSHHQDPNSLLLLAEAYLEDGQVEKADATAHEGLSRLTQQPPGVPAVRCRVLLEYTLTRIPVAAKARRSSLSPLITVFLSPYLSRALRLPSASLLRKFLPEAFSTNSPPGSSVTKRTTRTGSTRSSLRSMELN
jgi:hypothetical protein